MTDVTAVPWKDPRRLLQAHGLHAKRRFSQNFLCNPQVTDRIAGALAIQGAEPERHPVLELGPGLGSLTGRLLARGYPVYAVEPDPDMRRVLAAEYSAPMDQGQLQVEDGDATALDYGRWSERLGGPMHVMGNLPYGITGGIFRQLCDLGDDCRTWVRSCTFMIQREVADRLCAAAGTRSYGALTVFVRRLFLVRPLFDVGPGNFVPRPKVTSCVVQLHPREVPLSPMPPTLEALIRAVFQGRRKTLRNTLRTMGIPPGHIPTLFSGLGPSDGNLDERVRGETLTVEQLHRIAERVDADQS